MNIKCIGCFNLIREELKLDGRELVVYSCPRFPYSAALSGLLRPGSGILEAVKDCPENPLSHCAVCPSTKISHYGEDDFISICHEHDKAWGAWLEEHPERAAYMAPKGRVRHGNWVEVFREFCEDVRRQPAGK